MCKDWSSQQKSPSQFNRLFSLWQSLVYGKQKPYTCGGYRTSLHTWGGDTTCVCYWKCLSCKPRVGKEPGNQKQSEHLRAAAAAAESSRLRPSLRLRWFSACAFCLSDIASDVQNPGYKNIPLRRNMEERTKREISFNSRHTLRKFKTKEPKLWDFIEPKTSMSQFMSCYLGRHKRLALHFSWTSSFLAKSKSVCLQRGICPQNLGPCKSSCYLTGMQTYRPTISSMSHSC